MRPQPPRSPLFPYTTLFRSGAQDMNGLAETADLAQQAAALAPTGGRALGAANRELPTPADPVARLWQATTTDRKSTRLNSSHLGISYAVFCLKKKKQHRQNT